MAFKNISGGGPQKPLLPGMPVLPTLPPGTSGYPAPRRRGVPAPIPAPVRTGMKTRTSIVQQRVAAEQQRRGMATTRAQARANQGGMVESPQKPMNRGASQYMGGKNRSTNPVPKVITSGLINQKNTMWVAPQRKNGKVVKGGYLAWRNSNEGGRRGEPVTGTVQVIPGSTYYKNYHHKRMNQTGSGAAEVLSVAKYVNGKNVGSPQMTPAAQMGRAYKAKAKAERKRERLANQAARSDRNRAKRASKFGFGGL